MSWKVGLGHSENDVEIQGEIDFDFFEDDDRAERNTENPQSFHEALSVDTKVTDEASSSTKSDVFLLNVIEPEQNGGAVSFSNDVPEFSISVRTKRVDRNKSCGGNHVIKLENSNQSRVPKKVIETVIPNLEEPEVINIKDIDDFTEEGKTEDSGPSSSSVSMTDSDGMSSLSEDLTESESITDVTPLNSPYCCDSPLPQPTIKPNSSQAKEMEVCERREAVRFSEDVQWESEHRETDSVDLNVLVAAIKKLEVQQQNRRPVKQRPSTAASTSSKLGSCRSRKNMSFSNAEVRKIDQENQRLLKCIVSHQTRSKSALGTSPRASHLSSSQINRQRKQRQIQLDNMALLKRLESAKPSLEVSRSHLIRECKPRVASSSIASQRSLSRPSSSMYGCQNNCSYSLSSLSSSNDSTTGPASLDHPNGLPFQSVGQKHRNSQ